MGVVNGIRNSTKGIVPKVDGLFFRIGSALWREESTDITNHAFEDMALDECVADGAASGGGKFLWHLSRDLKGNGDSDLCLIEVCDVVNEGTFMANVNKPKTGRKAKGDNDGVSKTIETRMSGGKCLVNWISGREIRRIVLSATPGDTCLGGGLAVGGANPGAFSAAELLEGETGNILPRETQRIHTTDNINVTADVSDTLGLSDEKACTGGEGAAMGVVTHAMLANPYGANAGVSHKLHGTMCDTRTWAKEKDGDGRGGNVDNALVIRDCDGTILTAEGTVLQIKERHSILDLRECLQVWAFDAWRFSRHLTVWVASG